MCIGAHYYLLHDDSCGRLVNGHGSIGDLDINGNCVYWAHGYISVVLPSQNGPFWTKIIASNLGMWVAVNSYIPIKLFRNRLQTFCSKPKCGMDWLAQLRAALRSPKS